MLGIGQLFDRKQGLQNRPETWFTVRDIVYSLALLGNGLSEVAPFGFTRRSSIEIFSLVSPEGKLRIQKCTSCGARFSKQVRELVRILEFPKCFGAERPRDKNLRRNKPARSIIVGYAVRRRKCAHAISVIFPREPTQGIFLFTPARRILGAWLPRSQYRSSNSRAMRSPRWRRFSRCC